MTIGLVALSLLSRTGAQKAKTTIDLSLRSLSGSQLGQGGQMPQQSWGLVMPITALLWHRAPSYTWFLPVQSQWVLFSQGHWKVEG